MQSGYRDYPGFGGLYTGFRLRSKVFFFQPQNKSWHAVKTWHDGMYVDSIFPYETFYNITNTFPNWLKPP